MMADDAATSASETPETTAAEAQDAETQAVEATAAEKAKGENTSVETEAPAAEQEQAEGASGEAKAAKPATKATKAEPEQKPEPVPDPETCKAVAIGLPAFLESVLAGEWDGTEFEYYLEPAGVLHGPLKCTRAPKHEPQSAGLLMTRAAWKAKTLYLDDDLNPEVYELSFPKEFGYVKPLAHYKEESREHAQYPWSKKY